MKHQRIWTRRLVIRNALAATGMLVAGPLFFSSSRPRAGDLPKVSEDDPVAKDLQYTEDASSSSARENDTAFCHNCRYFKGKSGDEWARCDIFPGHVVAGNGWCKAWTAKS